MVYFLDPTLKVETCLLLLKVGVENIFFKINLFIYLFIFGCVWSSFLREGFP